jgi:hypothetical protein
MSTLGVGATGRAALGAAEALAESATDAGGAGRDDSMREALAGGLGDLSAVAPEQPAKSRAPQARTRRIDVIAPAR